MPASAAASTKRRRATDDDARADRETRERPRKRGVKNPRLIGRKFTGGANASLFIRQWAWKREMKTERERFEDAYAYPTDEDDREDGKRKRAIVLNQRKFTATGFASTVWDLSLIHI